MEFRYIRFKRLRSRKKRGFRCVLVVFDNFSKFGWTKHPKNKFGQTVKNSLENILFSSRRSPNLIEVDIVGEIYNEFFQVFLDKNNIKICWRKSCLGDVFAERFNHTIRDLLKRPVFEEVDGNGIDILTIETKQYNNPVHTSIKLSPIQASSKKEGYAYKNLFDKENRTKVSSKRSH